MFKNILKSIKEAFKVLELIDVLILLMILCLTFSQIFMAILIGVTVITYEVCRG